MAKKNTDDAMMQDGVTYGKTVNMIELNEFIRDSIAFNESLMKKGLPREVLAIWGPPGIGKTACAKQFLLDGYEVIDLPVAQFEEMGDFMGMPDIENGVTVMRPPHWVPREEKKGIILFDDFNRASTRIIKGMMQILQDYRTVHWSIPSGYTIVMTGNPENAEYIVTHLDSAIMTRMKHVTLRADEKAWASWAEDQKIAGPCINWILKYPEMLNNAGERTNPRSLTQWFRYCTYIGINDTTQRKIILHGEGCVDDHAVQSFLSFVKDNTMYVEPFDILNNYSQHRSTIKKYIDQNRIDVMSIMLERVKNVIINKSYKPEMNGSKSIADCIHSKNLRAILKDCKGAKDLVYAIIQQMIGTSSYALEMLITDSELGDLIKSVAL